MNEYDRLYRQAQRYKELYPKGTRILSGTPFTAAHNREKSRGVRRL